MTSEDETMKCICCDQLKEVLIQVAVRSDTFFMNRRGVCQDCIKTKDINKVCEEFEIRKTKNHIKEVEQNLKIMKEHLEKLTND